MDRLLSSHNSYRLSRFQTNLGFWSYANLSTAASCLGKKDHEADNKISFSLSRRARILNQSRWLPSPFPAVPGEWQTPVFIHGSLVSRSDSPETIPKTDWLWLSWQRRTGRRPSGSSGPSWWSDRGTEILVLSFNCYSQLLRNGVAKNK